MRKKTLIIAGSVAAAALVLGGTGIAFAATDGFERSDRLSGSDLDRASEAALAEIGGGTVTSAERDDDAISAYELDLTGTDGAEYEVRLDSDFAVLVVKRDDDRAAGADDRVSDDRSSGATVPSAGSSAGASAGPSADPDDLTGTELEQASAAALAATGGGTVAEAERSDDADHRYEVEVTLADGTDVDVELDDAFSVVRTDR
ncbi:PepSY domain-containing protein [Microbacteriaceae bacterium VKM Ac-2855]|nr:PepSY domain-containing protein [Microbacteriaceae bacterium VKM Ac-2855]